MGIYRQWKAPGEFNSSDSEGIRRQVNRLKKQVENINRMCSENKVCLIGGDLNLDRCKDNDAFRRPEIKALSPIWEEAMLENNLSQINF